MSVGVGEVVDIGLCLCGWDGAGAAGDGDGDAHVDYVARCHGEVAGCVAVLDLGRVLVSRTLMHAAWQCSRRCKRHVFARAFILPLC